MESLQQHVCVILTQARLFEESALQSKNLTFDLDNGHETIKSEGFLDLSQNILKQIAESDDLNCSEMDLYEVCRSWTEKRCGKKDAA